MKRLTKKDMALSLHAAGRSVDEIARALETHPSYVANILAAAGKTMDYTDLYQSTDTPDDYVRLFRGILRFKNVEIAQESVRQIDVLYRGFVAVRDLKGVHQSQLMALIGKNRAEGVGKVKEAQVFADWLRDHLDIITPRDSDVEDIDVECILQ